MAKKSKPLKIEDKIKELKAQIISNSKDAEWGKKMLSQLTSLQKQADIEPVELIVPCKEVKDTIEEDSYFLKRTPRGILFQTKSGVSTFVELRAGTTYQMLNQLFALKDTPPTTEEEKEIAELYSTAVAYTLQGPIFASLSEKSLYEHASHILQKFNEYVEENVENAELKEETEQDIKDNIEFENLDTAVKNLSETNS